MAGRILLGCAFIVASASIAVAIEPGELVVARRDVRLLVAGRYVDQVGAGQVLQVLSVKSPKIWVSRGRPGWIDAADVIPLAVAEAHFSKPFATGAGARDYLSRGTVRVALGKHVEGIADLKKAVQMANQPGEYLESLGYAQLAAADQAAAIETFTRALQDDPRSAAALMGRGLAYYQVGQNQNADTDLSTAIELEPQHAFPRKYLGALWHDLGKLDPAREQLDVAVKLDTHDVFARKARGRLRFDQGDYDGALEDFAVAVSIDGRDVEAVAGRGVVRHALGADLPAAEADFSRAIELITEPTEHAYLWNNRGQVRLELGKIPEALDDLNRAIELDSSFVEPRSHRAFLLVTDVPDATRIASAMSDMRAVFRSSEARTFWDYRAVAAVNAALGDFARAVKYQSLAEAAVIRSGPARFIQSATAARRQYEQRVAGQGN